MSTPLAVETWQITKRFGSFTALEDVSMKVVPGEFHALLGENGAGKSTLVKCIIGYQPVDKGSIMVDGQERLFANPRDSHALGLGMVYQHFTLVPAMTVAENLVMSRADVPAVIDWRAEFKRLNAFLETMPFRVPLTTQVAHLAAGERQKTEILKQLYLDRSFLILDEPTSVLTPAEADEMLGLMRGLTESGRLSVLMITHKFREVMAFADNVTVLRHGKRAGGGSVKSLSREEMAAMMVGARELPKSAKRVGVADDTEPVLAIASLQAEDASGLKPIRIDSMAVHAREIVGIAGVSGNGQRELVEVLAGQRDPIAGEIRVKGQPYLATRAEAQALRVRCLPEEPLRNTCAPRMSVAENLAFRTFDRKKPWLDRRAIAKQARALIDRYKVKAASPDVAISTLSGGNVQRSVLARELSDEVNLLVVANPCFGLDFSAVAEIRSQIVAARNAGAAVLLVSEDLDELLELSDRILVMSEGKIVHETPIETADIPTIGSFMAGHH